MSRESRSGSFWVDLLRIRARDNADDPAVTWTSEQSGGETVDWKTYIARSQAVAAGFVAAGVQPREFVAILAGNRIEHLLADLAILQVGATSVSVYETFAPEQIDHVLSDSAPSLVVVSDARVAATVETLPWVQTAQPVLVVIDGSHDGWRSWPDLEREGAERLGATRAELDARAAGIEPDDVLTMVYTSGTTGMPKGVMISHANALSMTDNMIRAGLLPAPYRSVGHLPLAHIAERLFSLYVSIQTAGHVVCCPDPKQLVDSLRLHEPTWLMTVPRGWEKLRRAMEAIAASEPFARRAEEIARSRAVLREYWTRRATGQDVSAELVEASATARGGVLADIRRTVGVAAVQVAATSTAPTPDDLRTELASFGVDVVIAYGLTETTGPVISERPGHPTAGSVGSALPDYEVSTAPDGEILLRGPAVALGYHNRPDATAEMIDADGWLHTGDVGRVDEQGRLFLTDRKKELIITASGKNISPTAVESHLQGRGFLDQVLVYGDDRPYLVALLTVDPTALDGFARTRGLAQQSVPAVLDDPAVQQAVQGLVDEANTHVSRPEQIKRFALLSDRWSQETGELTPTSKMRRSHIHSKYRVTIDDLYNAGQ